MSLKAVFQRHELRFRFEAGTSRGVLTQKNTWFIRIFEQDTPNVFGIGECAPLPGLSVDDRPDFEQKLAEVCAAFDGLDLEIYSWNIGIIINQLVDQQWPSMRFGLETAMHDYLNGGQRIVFKNSFSEGQKPILINGLIWMGKPEFMRQQIEEKLLAGYTTLKLKIGAIDFAEECKLLASIRNQFSKEYITLRVDANGAFGLDEVDEKLRQLAEFDLHSIEQPIKEGQPTAMAALCAKTPVPIALDEELIGKHEYLAKMSLLKTIRPQYIILKPTLLGGFQQCREWIEIANRLKIGWWVTSALESNVGLNAVAQFTAEFKNELPQGLGTGQLYHNNTESPLEISGGFLHHRTNFLLESSPVFNA